MMGLPGMLEFWEVQIVLNGNNRSDICKEILIRKKRNNSNNFR